MDERWVGGMEEENLESLPVFLCQREPDRAAGWRTGCYQLSWFWRLHNYFVNVKTKLCDSCSCRRLSDLLKAKKGSISQCDGTWSNKSYWGQISGYLLWGLPFHTLLCLPAAKHNLLSQATWGFESYYAMPMESWAVQKRRRVLNNLKLK